MTQFSERGQEDGPGPVLPDAPEQALSSTSCMPIQAMLGLFAAMGIPSRPLEGVREKTHVEGVSPKACMGARSTSV